MKRPLIILLLLVFTSCASGKDHTYIASTPADGVVRSFLGISLTDSVDFIRWKLIINDSRYKLNCQYGLSKPNTNGFMNSGHTIEISGAVQTSATGYLLQNDKQQLKIAKLNEDLLHLQDEQGNLLTGNGGWSYTLNNISPVGQPLAATNPAALSIKDSTCFAGRTPCSVPGLVDMSTACYKAKWLLVLYPGALGTNTGTYRKKGDKNFAAGKPTGNWDIITRPNGSIMYRLHSHTDNTLLYLVKLNDNVLAFSDANGRLLTGNGDFSYTLNRRF